MRLLVHGQRLVRAVGVLEFLRGNPCDYGRCGIKPALE